MDGSGIHVQPVENPKASICNAGGLVAKTGERRKPSSLAAPAGVIGRNSPSDDQKQAGVLAVPDANCPVRGAAAQLEESD